jgi:hypothetical protein
MTTRKPKPRGRPRKKLAAVSSSTEPESGTPPASPELERLEKEGANIDGGNPDEQEIPDDIAAPLAVNEQQEAKEFFGFVVDTLSQAWPYVGKVYTPTRVETIAGAWVPLANKYGWQLSALMGPELMFAIVILAPVPELVKEQKAWRLEQAKEAPATPSTYQPGAKETGAYTVTQPTGGNGAA